MDTTDRVLIVGNDADHNRTLIDAATVVTCAHNDGFDIRVHTTDGGGWPEPTAFQAIVVLGSRSGAWDDSSPWIAEELAFLQSAIETNTPILGICFGAQLLARALGGSVEVHAEPEHGLIDITVASGIALPTTPWFAMHFDRCTPPNTATILARNSKAIQAFSAGTSLGVQFHPEITPEVFSSWRETLTNEDLRLFAATDVDLDQLARDIESHRNELVDGFTAVWNVFRQLAESDRSLTCGRE